MDASGVLSVALGMVLVAILITNVYRMLIYRAMYSSSKKGVKAELTYAGGRKCICSCTIEETADVLVYHIFIQQDVEGIVEVNLLYTAGAVGSISISKDVESMQFNKGDTLNLIRRKGVVSDSVWPVDN